MNIVVMCLLFSILLVLAFLLLFLSHIDKKIDYGIYSILDEIDALDRRADYIQQVSYCSTPIILNILSIMKQQAVERENYELAEKLNNIANMLTDTSKQQDQDE